MIYQNDTYSFICNLASRTDVAPVVTTAPIVTIFNAVTLLPAVTSQAMALVAGTVGLYAYPWSIPSALPSGDYLAIVSYVVDGVTVSNQYLDRVRVGDTNIIGPVATDATVAKDSTVAKDATVAHQSDLGALNPSVNTVFQQILNQVNRLPADPASITYLATMSNLIADCRDYALGTWVIDKTQNPPVLTLARVGGGVLATFTVSETTTSAIRQRTS